MKLNVGDCVICRDRSFLFKYSAQPSTDCSNIGIIKYITDNSYQILFLKDSSSSSKGWYYNKKDTDKDLTVIKLKNNSIIRILYGK
jgi:hypothetical protein